MCMQRLKHEGRDKDARLSKPGDIYYQKTEEYSMQIYSYYECFKCKGYYYGGLKACEQNIMENNNYKVEDLLCPACTPDT